MLMAGHNPTKFSGEKRHSKMWESLRKQITNKNNTMHDFYA